MQQTPRFSDFSDNVARHFGYLEVQPGPLLVWQHRPLAEQTRNTIVVLCYPMGSEYVQAHRSVQYLADSLAQAGCNVLRFDFYATGDSGGSEITQGLWEVWQQNILAVVDAAREQYPGFRICVAGIRLGATLAYLAAQKTAVDQLVLWEPIIQGRRFLREMKALSRFVEGDEAVDLGYGEFAGLILPDDTDAAINKVKLAGLPLMGTPAIMCIYRGEATSHNEFNQWLETLHPSARIECLPGYEDMIARPHDTKIPTLAIAEITRWVSDGVPMVMASIAPMRLQEKAILSSCEDFSKPVLEQGLWYDEGQRLFGVLTQPPEGPAPGSRMVVFMNSGAVHHVGPNRLYVMLARALAGVGVASLRIDCLGLGDSAKPNIAIENDSYQVGMTNYLAAAINCLRSRFSSSAVSAAGLCSGAHNSFHGAVELGQQMVSEVVMINPLTFYWKEGMTIAMLEAASNVRVEQDAVQYSASMRDPEKWKKLFAGDAALGYIIRFVLLLVLKRLRAVAKAMRDRVLGEDTPMADDLRLLRRNRISMHLVLGAAEPGLKLIQDQAERTWARSVAHGAATVKVINDVDHTFTPRRKREELMAYFCENFSQ